MAARVEISQDRITPTMAIPRTEATARPVPDDAVMASAFI